MPCTVTLAWIARLPTTTRTVYTNPESWTEHVPTEGEEMWERHSVSLATLVFARSMFFLVGPMHSGETKTLTQDYFAHRTLLDDMKTYNVRNSDELWKALESHKDPVAELRDEAAEKAGIPLSNIDAEALTEWVNSQKSFLSAVDTDLKDARRRVSAAKPKPSKPAPEVENPSDVDGSDCPSDAWGGILFSKWFWCSLRFWWTTPLQIVR